MSAPGFVQFPDDSHKKMMLDEAGLDQAQLNKSHYIIQKAGLKKTDEVAELGCGELSLICCN